MINYIIIITDADTDTGDKTNRTNITCQVLCASLMSSMSPEISSS